MRPQPHPAQRSVALVILAAPALAGIQRAPVMRRSLGVAPAQLLFPTKAGLPVLFAARKGPAAAAQRGAVLNRAPAPILAKPVDALQRYRLNAQTSHENPFRV